VYNTKIAEGLQAFRKLTLALLYHVLLCSIIANTNLTSVNPPTMPG